MERELRIGVLGAGGLGRNAARVISLKEGVRLVAMCDQRGFAFSEQGIAYEAVEQFALLVLYLSLTTMSSGHVYPLDQGQNLG